MATKLQLITELSERTANTIIKSPANWTSFLKTVGWNYKYPFHDQLLIYAQRPDATACAPIELWNERFGRWVNRGAKGIALIDDSGSHLSLRHVFDVSDTNSRYDRPIVLWALKDGYSEYVIETLENAFGDLKDKSNMPYAIISAAINAAQDNYSDYLSDLLYSRENSFLEELDELNVDVIFKNALSNSVAYVLLVRCGYPANEFFSFEDFQDIVNFNTLDTISRLGAATSDISEMILKEIGATVKELQKSERNQNRTFAKSQDVRHNKSVNNRDERADGHGIDIHDAKRLSDTGSDAAGGRNAHREIWDVAKNIPEKPQERNIRQPDVVGATKQSSNRDRPDGEGTNRDNGSEVTHGESGTGQRDRPDSMDGTYEQSKVFSRGNNTSGTGLQLTLFPTVEQQIEAIEQAEDNKTSAFSISQEEIDHALCKGSGVQDGKFRIYLHYQEHHSAKESIDFLKQEYGIGGGTHFFIDGTHGNEWHDGKGISLSKNGSFITNPDIRLTWSQVAKRLGELISADRYLNSKEKEHLPIVRQEMEGRRQKLAEEAYARTILDREPESVEPNQLPSRDTVNYSLHLGDTVYLGADEYEVVSFDSNVVELRDMNCPILTKQFQRETFERMMRENPLNDHLIEQGGIPEQPAEEETQTPSPRMLYQTYLSEIVSKVRADEIYPMLRDRDTDPDSAKRELDMAIDRIVLSMQGEHPAFYEAYTNLSHFKEWFTEDVYQRTYQDYLTEKKDSVTIHSNDPDAPEWLQELRDVDRSHKGDTTQQSENDEDNTQDVEVTNVTSDHESEKIKQERINYHITNDELGHGGQKTKYGWNITAIRLLNLLETENRLATLEEQEILSRYVGWGGMPQVFDEQNSQWAKEYTELKELLDEDEYASARASTLNAHFTSPVVIKAMYTCLANMGFETGNILEPSCGVGNFLGLIPDSMKDSKLYGIELDSITGRIAKQLYQKANIAVQGFEETNLPDSFFDLAVGNVPFGSYGVADKKYDKYKFLIHDYFFAKTLDKVRPGGIIAFITSKGTMDKQNPEVRKYIAQRAELLGAIRLPNNAFLANAGTEVTADILFLQKKDRVIDIVPDWVNLSTTEDGIPVNSYFADNPDMILGTMGYSERMYGNAKETTCTPYENADLAELLREALENIHAEITEYEMDDISDDIDTSIPADPNVRNFSYTVVDGEVYYRENSRMNKVEVSVTAEGRIKGMIAIRDCVRDLIEYQTEDYSGEVIQEQQQKLNRLYDTFTSKYGLLNSRGNNMAFSDDSSYCLLCSLEILDENGELERKADMFTKRTIRQRTIISHVDTATEALAISIAEKACVDIGFMKGLTGLSEEQLINDLEGVVFRNPDKLDSEGKPILETADAYLSGNVREKLKTARQFAQMHPDIYSINVTALERVQPKDLSASEIDVRLGATWLPPDVVKDFIFELLETPYMYKRYIDVFYSSYTANWNVKGKNDDRSGNIKAVMTYGTNRINAYKIIEETLNLKDVRIFDTVYEDGVEKRVLNKKETAIAQQKQETIKEAFQGWIWKDPTRRERLTRIYNDRFNSIRPREYDGSHIRFTGMNPEISLRKHQVDAVAHILYGGNTLLAHCVGAGKTYEMTAAAMESKHLGLCQKSLFVVPNHLTEQWAAEFLQLYPSANILVATKKDFETKNRKKFCARIATGDYDAVIIGHSQFEKIPISQERQKRQLEEQIAEITSGIRELKEERGERYAIKQLEKTKKTLKSRLDKLNDTSRKDDVVTFEELGVDRLFVDEADFYKNLFLYTKMRNVAGLSQTEAQKSSDLFAKCRYLDELTEGRGIIFATGTPISNSITEMYTMQRYLQYEALRKNGLQHFDCWASTFGETVTAIELAPEGTGYRAKTRFARFYNLPELMNMFKEVADIKTADMLNLPVPKANYHNVAVKPSQFQQDMVAELAERAERVRNKEVEPYEDNMLKITNDGRKLALEQRLTNPMLPDYEDSKVNACVENIFRFWQENNDRQLTQLVFCDLSTPKNDGNFNVYDDVRQKLIERGVPADEVAFIHDANTETRKKELFAKVRKGQVRVLLGSTFKMGAGTNVQDRLIALHDLDCPWRPRDLEQRSGRIIRQGNKNDEVYIFRYVTENTFDAYLYQILENKQRFISQIMTSKSPVRSAEDIDETALSYAEVKALATGNPYIKEKMDLDIQVSKLKLLKANHLSQRYALEDRLLKHYPQQIKSTQERIAGYEKDLILYEKHNALEPVCEGAEDSKFAGMTVKGVHYTEKAKAGAAILEACKLMTSPEPQELGCYMEFPMMFSFDGFNKQYQITLRGAMSHTVTLGTDTHGNITRLNNVLAEIPKKLEYCREQLKTLHQQIETAKQEVNIPFEKDEELQTKSARLSELNILLNMDKHDNEMLDGEPDENVDVPEKKTVGYER
ncbi:MAG: helicase [Clostridia bacterium BRH_c25]|nr:MAG: helicase [Clostridia bacterium BRH_c25]